MLPRCGFARAVAFVFSLLVVTAMCTQHGRSATAVGGEPVAEPLLEVVKEENGGKLPSSPKPVSHGIFGSLRQSNQGPTYPDPVYSEGVNAPFIPASRHGVKSKTKACMICMLFNSKQKVAKKYSKMLNEAMSKSISKSREQAIGVQMTLQQKSSMQDLTGDRLYGSGSDSDIDRRKKDSAEARCLDLPMDKQDACLKKAKAMEPDPIIDKGPPPKLSYNPHSDDEPAPPNAGPPFTAFVEEGLEVVGEQLPDVHANEMLLNPSLAAGTQWDPSQVKSFTDPLDSANPMGPGDDGLTLMLQTIVCGNEESPALLTALYQGIVGDDLVVQCEPMRN